MGFLRDIFIRIDAIVYGILEQIFQLIINLANFDLFSAGVLDEFAKRIYLILGLVMVFKLMLSFIQILIDPDKLSDKESGVFNILKRVVISMILIVLVPSIFTFAKQLQERVLPLIPKVVLGIPLDVDDSRISYDETTTDPIAKLEDEQGNVLISTGKLMAYYSFLPFFYYNSGCEGLGTLNGTMAPDKSMNVEIYSVSDAVPHVNDKDGACSSTEDGYNYNYRYIISTLVGVYMVYVLVFVALKIAIRTIKFGLCQLVAPIPIASYIDPKSSKKAFDNWVSTSVKVYLDLFTRLIVVYFVIYIFKLLFDNEKFFEMLGKYGPFQGLLVALLIIVGLLNFAKEMPKFVSGMLGVSDGFSDIGDMFKGAGGMLAAGIGSRVAAAGNFINGMRGEGTIGQRLRRATGSAIAGRISGAYHGRMGALRGKGFKETWNTSTQGTWQRRNQRVAERSAGVSPFTRFKVATQDYFQFKDDISLAEGIQKSISNLQSADKTFKSTANDKMGKNASNISFRGFQTGSGKTMGNITRLVDENESAIDSSGNKALLELKHAARHGGRKSDGNYLSLGDLGAAQAAASQLGIGGIAQALSSSGDVFLAAQKDIQNDLRSGNAMNISAGSSILNNDSAIKRALTSIEQSASQEYSNIFKPGWDTDPSTGNPVEWRDTSGTLHKGINNLDQLKEAYKSDSATVDKLLDLRSEEVSEQISNSKTAAARQFNEQRKSQKSREK